VERSTKNALIAVMLLAGTLAFATDAAAGGPGSRCKPGRKNPNCPVTTVNTPPTISGTGGATLTTGQGYSFTPAAADPDGQVLTFTITNRPAWANFSPSTGRLSGTATSATVGEYMDIRISVSDGSAIASLAPFAITVNQANRAPTISGSPATAVLEGQSYNFTPNAGDADGDPLTFAITNRPVWASFDHGTGRLSGTPAPGTAGSYANVTIRVSDGTTTATLPAFAVNVQASATGSTALRWQPPTTRMDGSPLTNLAGFRIRYGNASGNYPNVITIANGSVTNAVVSNLVPGTYYFVTTAFDSAGYESNYSSPVSTTIQ
jgi:hypothetical protein